MIEPLVFRRSLGFLVLISVAACSNGSDRGGAGGAGGVGGSGGTGGTGGAGGTGMPREELLGPQPFEPVSPSVAVAKVKSLLVGLPVTDADLAAVNADPKALGGLVDQWSATPEFRARMLKFFQQAFQQTQTDIADYTDMFGTNTGGFGRLLLQSLEESFARTVLALMEEGRPFHEAVTTDRFMLNPPLMAILAYLDAMPRNDDNRLVQSGLWLAQKYPGLTLVRTTNTDPVTGVSTPIPFEETIDPTSPNFMRYYDPQPYVGNNPDRCTDPYSVTGPQALLGLFEFLFGKRPRACGATRPLFVAADYDNWRMVKIRAPMPGEERTIFWNVPAFRDPATAELVLGTPRVGFMTTPAFFANWPTNISNSARVTTNQALIVALGRSFDDRAVTVQLTESSADELHVQPDSICYGCHQMLDPMRDFFRQSYSISYSQQLLPNNPSNPIPTVATFALGATPVTGNGIRAFAQALADHPDFATAWTQKLCHFANASSCDASDPEFLRIVAAFKDSGHQWKTLVRELFSSPLVTWMEKTPTTEAQGVSLSIARREALCTTLGNRLLLDACGLVSNSGAAANRLRNIALSVPGAGYGRAETDPLMPHDPSLFFASATENLCVNLAAMVVDGAVATNRYSSTRREEAITDFVTTIMGLPPSHPQAPAMRGILSDHHAEALASPVSARDALRSTFVVACSSPFVTAHGY